MDNLKPIARKITVILFLAQSLGSAAFIAIGTINAIVGANLGGSASWAGLPSAVFQFGSALAALAIGIIMERFGRRFGLTVGHIIGVAGGVIAVFAIQSQSFVVFLVGLALMGVARASSQLSRFTAAEVHAPELRGRAISYVVLGGTVGSIVGPMLVGPSSAWMQGIQFDELTGPFASAGLIFLLASLVLYFGLNPDPKQIGIEIARKYPEKTQENQTVRPPLQILRTPNGLVAVTAMVFGQMVMVMLMGITSLHMNVTHHSLTNISFVFSSHTIGMFAFSIITGKLTDQWGRGPVILSGAALLVASCLLAPFASQVWAYSAALFLLGLGWNFCYVGGSTLLSDQLSPAERSSTQGVNDLLIGFATALGSVISGIIFASAGYTVMGIFGASLSLIPLVLTFWWKNLKQTPLPA